MNIIVANFKSHSSPFQLGNSGIYHHWRDNKLERYPTSIDDIMVEINDPRSLTPIEQHKMLQICKKTNMVIYASNTATDQDLNIPLSLGQYFIGQKLDKNWLADASGLSTITVSKDSTRQQFIPYTNRDIQWHTDGYYNTPQQKIRSLLLHAVQRAASGGDNALLDHEIAYILLREKNPDYIKVLMAENVMTIPARINHGKQCRAEQSGPVFSVDVNGDLHMRYTMRANHVSWSTDSFTLEALDYLQKILTTPSPYIFKALLKPGMGLVCNNVLHNRTAFEDVDRHKRLLYRARYFTRIKNTSILSSLF